MIDDKLTDGANCSSSNPSFLQRPQRTASADWREAQQQHEQAPARQHTQHGRGTPPVPDDGGVEEERPRAAALQVSLGRQQRPYVAHVLSLALERAGVSREAY